MSNYFRAIWVSAYRELLRFWQDKTRMVSSFAMPILLLVVFGPASTTPSRPAANPRRGLHPVHVPGIIVMTVFQTALFTGISVVWDREFGFLRECWWRRSAAAASSPARRSAPLSLPFSRAVSSGVSALPERSLTWALVVRLIPVLILIALPRPAWAYS